MATAEDYRWFEKKFEFLAVAYCFSYLRGVSAEEALTRFGVQGRRRELKLDDLEERAYDEQGLECAVSYPGAVVIGEWALIIEPNGYLGISELGVTASRGSELVAHFVNVNADNSFAWAVDADLRVTFDMMFPEDRDGSHPDGLLTPMARSGFNAARDEDEEPDDLWQEAGFALAANLTGVELTAKLLKKATFLCGRAPVR